MVDVHEREHWKVEYESGWHRRLAEYLPIEAEVLINGFCGAVPVPRRANTPVARVGRSPLVVVMRHPLDRGREEGERGVAVGFGIKRVSAGHARVLKFIF